MPALHGPNRALWEEPGRGARPWVIAHRGASGSLPELTLEAFDHAVRSGADAIEIDVVPLRDGTLLVRHENELSLTTNVADHPRFASRRTTRIVDGQSLTGWFSEDFTEAETRLLRARERFAFRDHSLDDAFGLVTLDEVLKWLNRQDSSIRLFVELKHPAYFAPAYSVSALLLETISRHLPADTRRIVAMSFEAAVLRELRHASDLTLVQLLAETADIENIARYAHGIGAWKRLIVPSLEPDIDSVPGAPPRLGSPTTFIEAVHNAGLFALAWTFRDEPVFLAADYKGDPCREYRQFYGLGIDGIMSDHPATALLARKQWEGALP